MKNIIFYAIFIISHVQLNCQEKLNRFKLEQEASSDYNSKNYKSATTKYLKLIELSDFKSQKLNATYNAACCLALQKKVDSAFIILNKALDYGFNYKSHLENDSDLDHLHNNPQWEKLINRIPDTKELNSDPKLAQIVTNDVYNFWQAYDLAREDASNSENIYTTHYFNKASDGMEDYMGSKVSSKDYFIEHIQSFPKLYETIRANTLKINAYKIEIQKSFENLKALYSDAKFPDVYFVIGALTSAGTVSNSGLLIGINQISDGDNVNTKELDSSTKLLMNKSKYVPNIVAHELIHFQQDGIKKDSITLGYAIDEGMADFIGEMISGDTANRKIFNWTKGKEKQIWTDFKKDMYFNRYNNWIANYGEVTKDSYPDLGYWIGYEICKSYYENATDKKQAIYDMFHIQDYRKFLADSKWELKLEKMN